MKANSTKSISSSVRSYLAKIGRKGGLRSRRTLSPAQAKEMLKVREARRAFRRFRTLCFWSYDPEMKISLNDIPWVVSILMKHGNREAWESAVKLCH